MLVCQFGLRQSLRPNSQTSNLYCHPSLQDCAGTSPSQTCGRPTAQMALAARLPHFKEEAVTVSSQLLRSLRLLHNCQLTVLVYAPPAPHGERIITREPQCQRERRAPYPAFHNIIPSELCNSRRHRQCSASREEVSGGQKPAKTAYKASDYTIRIMLRTLRHQGAEVLPSNSRVRRRQERAWRQWPACTRPFASPAPGRGIGAPISPIPLPRCRSASTASVFKRHLPHQPQSSASILPPYALRAGRYGCDSLWPDKQSTKSQEPLLQGKASPCLTWPLFLQASAGKNPARSLPGSQEAAVPAAGADSVRMDLPQTAPGG